MVKVRCPAPGPMAIRYRTAMDAIPQRESINQSLFRIMLDMDGFGGEEDRPPWADVVRRVGE